MQPWEFLPHDYEPPLRGEKFSIIWRSDMGPNVSVGGIGDYLQAFQTLLDLGERWGLVMAEEAAARSLVFELLADVDWGRNEFSLDPVRDVMPEQDDKRIWWVIRHLVDQAAKTGEHPETIIEIPSALRELASISVPDLMGSPLRTEAISYRNPIELIVFGGAFVAYGTIQALRLVRDWGARRRLINAAAELAEAEVRQAQTRADVIEYLGREVTAGRLHVSAAELGKLVTSTDLEAIAKLAGTESTLQLPEGVSEIFSESSPNH